MRNARVFIGYLDHCGHFSGLAKGFQDLGHEAYFLNLGDKTCENASGLTMTVSFVDRFYRNIWRRTRLQHSRLMTSLYIAASLVLVIWISARFDIIILNSGESLFATKLDLKIFRFFRRRTAAIFHGTDSRPSFINGICLKFTSEELRVRTAARKRHVVAASPYINYIIDNPLCSHFHEREVWLYQAVGIPVAGVDWNAFATTNYSSADGIEAAPLIVHCPSDSAIKGSKEIRTCIDALRAKGLKIRYVEITGVPRAQVLNLLASADLVIDQLYADIEAAALASEACLMGKAVVVGGYGGSEFQRLLPESVRAPVAYVLPEALEETVEHLVRFPAARAALGQRARKYAAQHCRPSSVAANLLAVVTGRAPECWRFDPSNVRYVGGVGAATPQIHQMLKEYIERFGTAALELDDKPDMVAFIKMAVAAD